MKLDAWTKLSHQQQTDIEENIDLAMDALAEMRGCNDREVSSIHAWLQDTLDELSELRELTWRA